MIREASEGETTELRCIKDNYMENSNFIWLSLLALALSSLELDWNGSFTLLQDSKISYTAEHRKQTEFLSGNFFILR